MSNELTNTYSISSGYIATIYLVWLIKEVFSIIQYIVLIYGQYRSEYYSIPETSILLRCLYDYYPIYIQLFQIIKDYDLKTFIYSLLVGFFALIFALEGFDKG